MSIQINAIKLGVTQNYILKGEGVVLIDAGQSNRVGKFRRGLEKLGIRPEEVKLIIITHGHFDHIGSAKEIAELTGAKIAIHEGDREWLEKGVTTMPGGVTGWGRFTHGWMKVLYLPFIRVPAATPSIVMSGQGLSLADYGIQGRVLHTPGHSPGSMSVVLDSGEAFVGDMAMNGAPFCTKPSLPIFAADLPRVKESWKILFAQNVKQIYPSHGKPFPAEVMAGLLEEPAGGGAS
jgi:hydroxyacylglutathione hydrolase